MIQSFRLRLVLSSATLAGMTLALFSFSTLWLIYNVNIEHIDQILRSHAERETGRPPWSFDWIRVERDIAASFNLLDKRNLLLLIQDVRGKTAYRSPHWSNQLETVDFSWPQLPILPNNSYYKVRPITTVTDKMLSGQVWHFGLANTDQARVAVGINLQILDDEIQKIRIAFLIATPVALFLIGFGAWFFSKKALRPIEKLTAATQHVTVAGLNQRLLVEGNDREFAELIMVFNGMLERLERSFQQSQRFSADAAHELKTPLAILQGQLERALHSADEGSPMQTALTSILDEVRRLSMISRKLLLLSQADAGRLHLHRESFNLSQILDNLVEDVGMLAPHLKVTAKIQPDIVILADCVLIHQIMHNLIANAIKYNIDNGWIQLSTQILQEQIEICIVNTSHGIPPDARERIFDRFYRAKQAHYCKIEGVGLGLALSREIARAHGGDLFFRVDNADNVWFFCMLPKNISSIHLSSSNNS